LVRLRNTFRGRVHDDAILTATGRRVVVKVVGTELAEGVHVDRFLRDLCLAASLQHPHIVPVLTTERRAALLRQARQLGQSMMPWHYAQALDALRGDGPFETLITPVR
jgi:hypothetical protein